MPYSGPDDPSLPKNVKPHSETTRRRWAARWNSVYNNCTESGGDSQECEAKAFRVANGMLGEEFLDEEQTND